MIENQCKRERRTEECDKGMTLREEMDEDK